MNTNTNPRPAEGQPDPVQYKRRDAEWSRYVAVVDPSPGVYDRLQAAFNAGWAAHKQANMEAILGIGCTKPSGEDALISPTGRTLVFVGPGPNNEPGRLIENLDFAQIEQRIGSRLAETWVPCSTCRDPFDCASWQTCRA